MISSKATKPKLLNNYFKSLGHVQAVGDVSLLVLNFVTIYVISNRHFFICAQYF